MTKVVHVVCGLLDGGVEQGILTLAKNGFYNSTDLHIVELYKGRGTIRESILQEVGKDNVTQLFDYGGLANYSHKQLPRLTWELEHTFRALKPDTLILSTLIPKIAGTIAAIPHPNVKVVAFEHDSRKGRLTSRLAAHFTSWRSDAVFGDTPETIRQCIPTYWNRPSYYVPLAILEPGTVHDGHVSGATNILSLGRLALQKNHAELIHATSTLIKEGHNITLTIAGEGHQRTSLEQLVQTLDQKSPGYNIAGRIKLLGFISDQQTMHQLMDQSHIYVQPSVHEGFCLAAAEALAAGVPTAATDFAGARDYGNAKNMKKIEGTTRIEIARTLRDMIIHYSEIAQPMSQAAIQTAQQKFNRTTVTSQWIPAIEALTSPRFALPKILSMPTEPSHHILASARHMPYG